MKQERHRRNIRCKFSWMGIKDFGYCRQLRSCDYPVNVYVGNKISLYS